MADWSDHEWKLLIGGELVDGASRNVAHREPGHRRSRGPRARGVGRPGARRRARRAGGVPGVGGHARSPSAPRCCAPVTDQLMKLQADLVPLIIAETGATATVGSRMQVPVAIERFERYAA